MTHSPHEPGAPAGRRPRGRAFFGFLGVCLAVLAIDFVHHRHTVLPIESLPGFVPMPVSRVGLLA